METIARISGSHTMLKSDDLLSEKSSGLIVTTGSTETTAASEETLASLSAQVDRLLEYDKLTEEIQRLYGVLPTQNQLRKLVYQMLRKTLNGTSISETLIASIDGESESVGQLAGSSSIRSTSTRTLDKASTRTVTLKRASGHSVARNNPSSRTITLNKDSATTFRIRKSSTSSAPLEKTHTKAQHTNDTDSGHDIAKSLIPSKFILKVDDSRTRRSKEHLQLCEELRYHLSDLQQKTKNMQARQSQLNEKFQAEIQKLREDEYRKMQRRKERKQRGITTMAMETVERIVESNPFQWDTSYTEAKYPSDDYYYFRMKYFNTLCCKKSLVSASLNSRSAYCLPMHMPTPIAMFQMPSIRRRPIGEFIPMSPRQQRVRPN